MGIFLVIAGIDTSKQRVILHLSHDVTTTTTTIQSEDIMTTITNTRGTKAVVISTDATGTVRASYVQYCFDGINAIPQEQLLDFRSFATIKNAERWANKVLA